MTFYQDYILHIPEIFFQHGMRHAVLSPGSRNAPLIQAFANHPYLQCHSVIDERSAAYVALGIIMVTQAPVAVICTSGSAVMNFAPAITEASHQQKPLIVVTADRPAEWIGQLENQTIQQQHIFHPFVKKSFQLPVKGFSDDECWHANRIINETVALAKSGPSGPVHLNIPLREPLYKTMPEDIPSPRIIQLHQKASTSLAIEATTSLKNEWASCNKKLIVCGVHLPDENLNKALEQLALHNDVVVMAENLSNQKSPLFISNADLVVHAASQQRDEIFQPDLVVTIGQHVVSKKIKSFLRGIKLKAHWHIDENGEMPDVYQQLTAVIQANPVEFLLLLDKEKAHQDNFFQSKYYNLNQEVQVKVPSIAEQVPFSDLFAINKILQNIPDGAILHLANSTPVRYAQFFKTRKNIDYYANRGTSGIDGCLSTAVGHALACDEGKEVFVLIGDVALLYDSNALDLPKGAKLKIILLNNNGGNIFKLLNTNGVINNIERFFTTPRKVDIQKLSEAYGWKYMSCSNQNELYHGWKDFISSTYPALFEIKTDPEVNTSVYKSLYQQII